MNEEETQVPVENINPDSYYGAGAPIPEEKHNIHSFLTKVITSDDTTKVGNLTADEVGLPKYNLRTLKEIALIADKIMDNNLIAEYFDAKAEILTATSLSKDAKLINLAVMQKRQIEDVTRKPMKENSGWFKPKGKDLNNPEGEQQQS